MNTVVVKAVYEIVQMDQVPDPPVTRKSSHGAEIYQAIRALGLGERDAAKVKCRDHKHFFYLRAQLRKFAEMDGKMLCSSRNGDSTEAYFWLVKKGS